MELHSKMVWWKFIKTYKNFPCLWKLRHPDYVNRLARDKAYNSLLEIAKQFNPSADIGYVTTKINSFRTSFRREYKKVLHSKRKTTSEEDWYKPTLWYYEMMLFTVQNNPSRSTSYTNTEPEESNIKKSEEEYSSSDDIPFHSVLLNKAKSSTLRSNLSHISDENLEMEMNRPSIDHLSEEFIILGRRLAYQLQELDSDQRNCAERIFADVIFYGKLGRLNEFSTLRVTSLLKQIRPSVSRNIEHTD